MSTRLMINGEERLSTRPPMTPLVDVLREDLVLTGVKPVCSEGFCGACTVLLDGRPAMSCLLPIGTLGGRTVATIESLAPGDGAPTPLQQALLAHDAVQCGMCFPGMVMSLTFHLAQVPDPTRADIEAALVGNVCRCTGYDRIVEAALSAARQGRS